MRICRIAIRSRHPSDFLPISCQAWRLLSGRESTRTENYGGPQGQSTTQYWAGYTTIFRDTKQFFAVHKNLSWYKTIFHGTQQSFVIQKSFSRYTTIFRDAKQFFTVHNNLWWDKTIFHGTQQSSVMQNNFSWNATIFRDITAFHDAKLNFTIQN